MHLQGERVTVPLHHQGLTSLQRCSPQHPFLSSRGYSSMTTVSASSVSGGVLVGQQTDANGQGGGLGKFEVAVFRTRCPLLLPRFSWLLDGTIPRHTRQKPRPDTQNWSAVK